MRVLSILHPGGGHSGILRERAAAGGHELLEITPAQGATPPPYDAMVVLGGGMNVHEAARLPWLRTEVDLIRDALAAGTPVLGICLGAQLLATAAGAAVRRVEDPEIGWFEVERLPAGDADPLLGALPERFTAFQWHSYTFDLPAGAIQLARSPASPQAFRLNGRAWGVQFHPEVTPDVLSEWFDDFEADPDAVAQGFDPARAEVDAARRLPAWNAIGADLFDAFLRER
jgi:GMP synthase (glutamine-hydrolysing)